MQNDECRIILLAGITPATARAVAANLARSQIPVDLIAAGEPPDASANAVPWDQLERFLADRRGQSIDATPAELLGDLVRFLATDDGQPGGRVFELPAL